MIRINNTSPLVTFDDQICFYYVSRIGPPFCPSTCFIGACVTSEHLHGVLDFLSFSSLAILNVYWIARCSGWGKGRFRGQYQSLFLLDLHSI